MPAAVRIGRAPGHCDFGDCGGVQDPMLGGYLLGGKKRTEKMEILVTIYFTIDFFCLLSYGNPIILM